MVLHHSAIERFATAAVQRCDLAKDHMRHRGVVVSDARHKRYEVCIATVVDINYPRAKRAELRLGANRGDCDSRADYNSGAVAATSQSQPGSLARRDLTDC